MEREDTLVVADLKSVADGWRLIDDVFDVFKDIFLLLLRVSSALTVETRKTHFLVVRVKERRTSASPHLHFLLREPKIKEKNAKNKLALCVFCEYLVYHSNSLPSSPCLKIFQERNERELKREYVNALTREYISLAQ